MHDAPIDAALLRSKTRFPAGIVLGTPAEVSQLVAALGPGEITCYQMDLYPAERLREELTGRGLGATVVTAPDLWDLPPDFGTVLYRAAERGERDLKIDMVDQAYHVLRPWGTLLVLSPREADQLFPAVLKKVFGRFHAPISDRGQVFWSQRAGDRPRRRHEMTFHVRADTGPPLSFLSRPGVFSYGRFDDGARALTETVTIKPGERIIDVGCGCGTNGIIAARRSGPQGEVTFIDSNVRALALAEHNASANGLVNFQTVASSRIEGPPAASFDVALANPPYFAQSRIARLFIERARVLLRPGGRFYLVTKQPDQVGPLVAETFGTTQVVSRRGYAVLCA
jgi:16S rRNA (guanine1207-N2)-methyltransferase